MEKQFQFKKKYGQNFLKDSSLVAKISQVAQIPEDSLVIEIGAGKGILTEQLAKRAKYVLSYEIDLELKSFLIDKFQQYSNVSFVFDDFLKRDVSQDIANYQVSHIYIVANLPYYITTPIIMKLISEPFLFEEMVVMVQKEVGDRFAASPGSRAYGALSVLLQYYFDIKKEFLVKRTCFYPVPNVDSVIVSFKRKKELLKISHFSMFEEIVHACFRYKRKNLRNNLKQYDLVVVDQVLQSYGYTLQTRAEELPLEVFVALTNALTIS